MHSVGDHIKDTVERKSAFTTTEFIFYILAVAAVVITALAVGDDNGSAPGGDPFGASQALGYIVVLTFGYMIARGLAKSGGRRDR